MTNPLPASGDQIIQSQQYHFPYHYIGLPNSEERFFLSRHWSFSASYMAALRLVSTNITALQGTSNATSPFFHLDVGCGDGGLLYYLDKIKRIPNIEIEGVDKDANATKWAVTLNPLLNIHTGLAKDLPKEKYHSISLIEVLEHVPPDRVDTFLDEIRQLLRPGGTLIITVPSTEKPLIEKHFQHFSLEAITNTLSNFFTVIQVRGFEKTTFLTKILISVRNNNIARIDSPLINKLLVKKLQKTHSTQHKCGRIIAICKKSRTRPFLK